MRALFIGIAALALAGCLSDYVTHEAAEAGVTRIRFDVGKDDPLSGGPTTAETAFNAEIHDICPHGHERLRAWRTGDSFTNYVYFWDVRCLGSEPLSKQPHP
jgi:hypothetical protein